MSRSRSRGSECGFTGIAVTPLHVAPKLDRNIRHDCQHFNSTAQNLTKRSWRRPLKPDANSGVRQKCRIWHWAEKAGTCSMSDSGKSAQRDSEMGYRCERADCSHCKEAQTVSSIGHPSNPFRLGAFSKYI